MAKIEMADWKATRKQKKLVKEVLNSGRLTYGDKTRELEKRFADIHGVKYALFTSSGTAALKIALHALKEKHGWKDGDEVIIPSVTFVATMNVVLMNNLKPVLVDVRAETANLDPGLLSKSITKRTVAILPVHLLGQPANMKAILKIAKEHKLKVVEDSCETMFVTKVQGDIACFSTYLAHLLVTGIGGFITTNDEQMATTMRSIMFHGRDESYLNIDAKSDVHKKFYFPRFGYSDRMTEMEAAIGLGDLDNWEEMIKQRQDNARYIRDGLWSQGVYSYDTFKYIDFPIENYKNHAFMFFPMYAEKRDQLAEYLEYCGIDSRLMMPLTTQPVTKPYLKKKYPNADYINKHGLLIGCHQYLKKKDLDKIIRSIKEFYEIVD